MTPTQIRLRIVELRSRLVTSKGISSAEEETLLAEIEDLRKQLNDAPAAPSSAPLGEASRRVRAQIEDLARTAGVDPGKRLFAPSHEGRIAPDRRKHPRFSVSVPVRFHIAQLPPATKLAGLSNGRRESLQTRDLSQGGLRVLAAFPVPTESRIEIEIPDPDAGVSDKPRPVGAKVVRCQQRQNGEYEIGVRFLSPDELPFSFVSRLRVLWGGLSPFREGGKA